MEKIRDINIKDYSPITPPKVFIDEINITDRAIIDSTYLIVTDYTLLPGLHNVRVEITNLINQKYNDIILKYILNNEQKKK